MCRYYDKVPDWIDRFRAEGLSENEIQEILRGKTEKYIGKWGNTSKVGILINAFDDQNQSKRNQARLMMSPRNQATRIQ